MSVKAEWGRAQVQGEKHERKHPTLRALTAVNGRQGARWRQRVEGRQRTARRCAHAGQQHR